MTCDGKSSANYIKIHGLCASCKKKLTNRKLGVGTDSNDIEVNLNEVGSNPIEVGANPIEVGANPIEIEGQPIDIKSNDTESNDIKSTEDSKPNDSKLNIIIDIYNKARFDTAKFSKQIFIDTLRFRINEFINEFEQNSDDNIM